MLFKPMETRIQSLFYELKLLGIKDLFSYAITKCVHKFTSDSLPHVSKNNSCIAVTIELRVLLITLLLKILLLDNSMTSTT